ncbi:MAG TPA: hypothetical protein VM452_18495 [Caulifigura sp.]|nr:hypothetical protein [Caulifigura sp.]
MASSFPVTRWSLIARAIDSNQPASREHMGELLEQYWRPMLVHLKCKGLGHAQSEDVLQDFVLTLLDKNLLTVADPTKGKFRSLLLTALDRFLVSKFRHDSAAKRSPGHVASLDAAELDVAQPESEAALAFERAWALDVLAETLSRMKSECDETDEGVRWQLFEDRVVRPMLNTGEPTDYAEFAKLHGLDNEKAAMNLLVTAKRQFARVMRDVIAEYLTRSSRKRIDNRPQAAHPAEPSRTAEIDLQEHQLRQAIEQEISDLRRILVASRGVADLAKDLAETPEAAKREPQKSEFFRILTTGSAQADDSFETLLTTGMETTDDALAVGMSELLGAPLSRVPGLETDHWLTLGELLDTDAIDARRLTAVKDWAGTHRISRSGTMPPQLANALYFLVLAAAITKGQRELTRLGESQLIAGFESLEQLSWFPPEFLRMVREARQAIARKK